MAEQDRESLRKFLAEEAEKQSRLVQSQEEVRQELERGARQAIEKYQQEFEELTPLAKEKVQSVIQPWFNNLVQDGTYDQILKYLMSADKRSVSISDSILYYWPDKAIQGFEYDKRLNRKPFEGTANYVVKNYEDHQQGIERHQAGVDEVWSAGFQIGGASSFNNILNYYHGFHISQWPLIGSGFGFAVGRARQLEIQVNPKNISASIPSIHPDVWIGFADQVENGTALEVLRESLIPKPTRVVDVGSAEYESIVSRDLARREEYLKGKMARGQ